MMVAEGKNVCLRCGKWYEGIPATSRVDNETEICPDCGVEEALSSFAKHILEKMQ